MAMALPMRARLTSMSLLWTSQKWQTLSNKMTGHKKGTVILQYKLWNCQRQRTYYNFRKRGVKALCFNSQNFSTQRTKSSNETICMDFELLQWWQERIKRCKKPFTKELIKNLGYSNILGLNEKLKNGSIKHGSSNWELLEIKWKFPREVILRRVGEFYEAVGFDACILVEYADLNPVRAARFDTVPKAGCPVMNLRQTLDALTRNRFSVCVVEEVQGPNRARTRKERFISGHAHPGSPYVYGLAGDDIDVDFSEPVPVIGISRSARGYCFISVLETMQTYSVEDGLTEEAVVAKLRAQTSCSLFLHSSLKNNLSGSSRWGAFGEGGLLWGECYGKYYEWFDGNSITQLLSKVRELYGLDLEQSFRNVTMPFEKKPRPLDLGTAIHIGVIPTERIPSLLKVLLPLDSGGLCERYLKDLLLNPPPFQIASSINAACRLMNNVTCAVPDFTCVPAPKLAKLIRAKEANHMEFLRIFNMTRDILYMYEKHELKVIIEKLLDPTWMATGLKYNIEALVSESREIACAIGDKIVIEGELMEEVTSVKFIPVEFFRDNESSWKGRVKRVHAENVFGEVDDAAEALYLSVKEDFLPIVLRVGGVSSPPGGSPQAEIAYAKDHESVWFKGKRFTPVAWANTPGEEKIKKLIPAVDAKGRKVEVEWYTTKRVEEALNRYREAVVQAKLKVTDILRELAAQLQLKMNTIIFLSVLSVITKTLFCHARYREAVVQEKLKVTDILRELAAQLQLKMNTIIFLSVLSVITKTLFCHASEGRKRNWVFPTLNDTNQSSSVIKSGKVGMQLEIVGLVPYWFNIIQENAIRNTIQMQSLFLLTGPNGGGKSSIFRSIGATALLGICGLMVPAETAIIPEFDSILLHMGSYDSPADHKSSFQMEMSEMRSVLCEATDRTLVLIDEICRGTEIQKGTCIAASMIEELDSIGCIGIVSTHLHGLLDVQLNASHILYKAMGTKEINGHIKPTWKLIDGACRESLAFETARCEGIPEKIISRAEQLYSSLKQDNTVGVTNKSRSLTNGIPYSERPVTTVEVSDTKGSYQSERNIRLLNEAQKAFSSTCEEKLLKLHSCTLIKAREQPPPTLTNSSCVYILQRPDGRFYVGETDNLAGRISAHRSVEGMQTVPFLYSRVPGKSMARKLVTVLINKLRRLGFELVNKADHSHQKFGTDY